MIPWKDTGFCSNEQVVSRHKTKGHRGKRTQQHPERKAEGKARAGGTNRQVTEKGVHLGLVQSGQALVTQKATMMRTL